MRLGKGAGYTDIELGLLSHARRLLSHTQVVTSIHDLQLVYDDLPEGIHDSRVDVIVTPTKVERTMNQRTSPGILWTEMEESRRDEIPVLAELQRGMELG